MVIKYVLFWTILKKNLFKTVIAEKSNFVRFFSLIAASPKF